MTRNFYYVSKQVNQAHVTRVTFLDYLCSEVPNLAGTCYDLGMTKTEINPQAVAILAQIVAGETRLMMPKKPWIAADLVVEITEKSVIFADGSRANIRSLHNFAIAK